MLHQLKRNHARILPSVHDGRKLRRYGIINIDFFIYALLAIGSATFTVLVIIAIELFFAINGTSPFYVKDVGIPIST